MKTVRVSLLAMAAALAGCVTALPSDGPSVTYRGMEAQREVVAQCPVGYVMGCRGDGTMVGSVGMSCSCVPE